MVIDHCTAQEGKNWQFVLHSTRGGKIVNSWVHRVAYYDEQVRNGVAGSMLFRCEDITLENCEFGYVSIGKNSMDGQTMDYEGNCTHIIARNCLFHDTEGPGFLMCWRPSANANTPNRNCVFENCVFNCKEKRWKVHYPAPYTIFSDSEKNTASFRNCRFYLSEGECLANVSTSWKAFSPTDQWLQLDFGRAQTINEFLIREPKSSSVIGYAIECWDEKAAKWIGCFNGYAIGADFIAPIVSRTTPKVRLLIKKTGNGSPAIAEFEAYNDTTLGPPARTREGEHDTKARP